MNRVDRVLLQLSGRVRRVIDPADVYYLEAAGDETIVRGRSRRVLRDVRSLGEVLPAFARFPFHRVHEKWAVNLNRVREIRTQKDGKDLEVVMQPPVNRLIPVARARKAGLLKRFG